MKIDNAKNNTSECAWVFAGGEFDTKDFPRHEVKDNDFFVGVDSGAEHCLAVGYVPNVLIGDLDSIKIDPSSHSQLSQIPHHVYPEKKAASDLELALGHLLEMKPKRVVILGVSGGRTDHMLFNWNLPLLRSWPFQLQFIDKSVRAYVLTEQFPLQFKGVTGSCVSILPLTEIGGITTVGLEYPLSNDLIKRGSTLGLSNSVVETFVQVSVKKGVGLVLVVK